MAQEGYQQIPVRKETWGILKEKKLIAQAKIGHDITWDKFLLNITK